MKLVPTMNEFHLPIKLIGNALPNQLKLLYEKLIIKIDQYINESYINNKYLLAVLDYIDEIKEHNHHISIPVLSESICYLRSKILSNNGAIIYRSILIADAIVKNSGYKLHVLIGYTLSIHTSYIYTHNQVYLNQSFIGQKKFMKTLGLIGRKYLNDSNDDLKQRASRLAIDCIQAWGEAFYPREKYYPHIYRTYLNIRNKYNIQYPRPDFDPTRVPIFLGTII